MVKVRMNTADVAAEVKCLRKLIGMRCANVYDISPKTYLFKLMNSSGITESGESEKVLLLMESGVRLHTTQYMRDKNTTPSGFTLKLRRHIRTRRLEDVRQLGYDRIILFQFGLGANAHYIILELYAQGNILLTDHEFTVMTLLRSHRDDNKGLAIMSRHRYPIEACRLFSRTDFTKLKASLTQCRSSNDFEASEVDASIKNCSNSSDQVEKINTSILPAKEKKANDGVRSKKSTLKAILGEALSYGPALAEHIILDADLSPHMKVGNDYKIDESTISNLVQAITKFEDWLMDIISGSKVPEGYILMKIKDTHIMEPAIEESAMDKVYDEFCPILLNQFKSRACIQFETFDAALDEFYSKIESQRSEQQQKSKESSAMQKLNKIRLDQENRVHTLKKEVDHCIRMAELIEYNLEEVDAAILAVRVALAHGMAWDDLARMIKEEKKSGNPVAGLIDKLYLERNCITLLLSNNLDEMDEEEKTFPADKVEVDLALSAHANARRWYEMKKRQEVKQEKTIIAHDKAFKAAEKKTSLQLAQEKTVAAISHIRRVHWFEKFNWFISSENYLIISGRDAQQNEMIVKRYLSKGDIYIHADLHGASSTVIKNHKPDYPIPPITLNQAGCFTVCHSQAWDSKIVTSAWWVYPHQVSKTAPTGEYLTAGSFMIRGKKNFLPPHPLIMGFGILFRLDESSLGSHLNERRVRGEDEGPPEMEGDSHKEFIINSDPLEKNTTEISTEEFSVPSKLDTDQHEVEISCNDICATIHGAASDSQIAETAEDFSKNLCDGKKFEMGKISNQSTSQLDDLIDKALSVGPAKLLHEDSGLNNYTSNLSEDEAEIKAMGRDKPYISKADRRKLKKNLKNGNIEINETNGIDENDGCSTSSTSNKGHQNPKPANMKITRGQKGKLKKIKEKYAEQDEEERGIRMALLGSTGRGQKKEKVLNDFVEATSKSVKAASGIEDQSDSSKICYKCKKPGHLARDCQENMLQVEHAMPTSDEHGDVSEYSRAKFDGTTIEMDKIEIEEEGIHELGDEEKEKLNELDYLTGNPVPNDVLLYAVPVCGPYNALQTYKYRVKITPGTAKKGKATKSAMNLFHHMPEVTNREKELMKACTDAELIAAIIGNAKVTAPGLTQLKQKQKKGKKSAKNES